MKKIFALVLAILMTFSLVACGDSANSTPSKEDTEILGEWKSFDETVFKFESDGKGELNTSGTRSDFTWKYDPELSVYVIAISIAGNINASFKTEDGVKYLSISGKKHYSPEVFAQMLPSKINEAEQVLADRLKNRQKAELGKEYVADPISVRFDLTIEDGDLWLCANVTNNGTTPITLEQYGTDACPVSTGYGIEYYRGSEYFAKSIGGFNLTILLEAENDAIAPGKTGVFKTRLAQKAQWIIDTYGAMIGYVSCSVGNNSENEYILFSDKFGK